MGSMLTSADVARTGAWLASQQEPSGAIPWSRGGKLDPWDHVHAAMGLVSVGEVDRARAAFRYLAATQQPSGGWPAELRGGRVHDPAEQSNHAAYLATGLWHLHRHTRDVAFLAEMWPTLDRAMELVVSMQLPSGAIAWAQRAGRVWRAPLVAGSASIHGSLACAERIAERLGLPRPAWTAARGKLAHVLRHHRAAFEGTDLPEPPGRHSMDWYYPVLGGALRGSAGAHHLRAPEGWDTFVREGAGCRCVSDAPWFTVAETAELVLALHTVGLGELARELLSWTRWQRTGDGSYWTGTTHPGMETYPAGEQTTWTAATVLLADAAVHGRGRTAEVFGDLDGSDLDAHVGLAPAPAAPAAMDAMGGADAAGAAE
jgi:hypothetical protein